VKATSSFWTHQSVKPFADSRDPVEAMIERANTVVLDAVERGWKGPPFDTFELANLLGFSLIPCDSIRDARLIPVANNRFQIEYNSNQTKSRIRFSIAHEIAHTFFPDCRERVRNRATKQQMTGQDWQLEMLCNIGAAELLMPLGSFPEIGEAEFSIDHLLRLRERFQVSTEAVLLRYLKLSRIACGVFAASNQGSSSDQLSIDYLRTANDWDIACRGGFKLPDDSLVKECRAIGFTAKGDETWDALIGKMHIECVAVPSYPGADNPRVVGLISPRKAQRSSSPTIEYLVGSATEPRGEGDKIIAHVVNDATARWGGGFARVLANRWPEAQSDFVSWTQKNKSHLCLGQHRLFRIGEELSFFHMIAQHGFGPSEKPRIRYRYLETCLSALAEIARQQSASIHMPRIACGQAGGNWSIVSEMIQDILCRSAVKVTVYDLPSERIRWEQPNRERSLFDDV
jgi:O-acetyl-ADP-ribose deacetylase (regulator of RNase III)